MTPALPRGIGSLLLMVLVSAAACSSRAQSPVTTAAWPPAVKQVVDASLALAQSLVADPRPRTDEALSRQLAITFGPPQAPRHDQQGLASTRSILPREGLAADAGRLVRYRSLADPAPLCFRLHLALDAGRDCIRADSFVAHAGRRFRYLRPMVMDRPQQEPMGPFRSRADALWHPVAQPGWAQVPFQAEGLPLDVHVLNGCIAGIVVHGAN